MKTCRRSNVTNLNFNLYFQRDFTISKLTSERSLDMILYDLYTLLLRAGIVDNYHYSQSQQRLSIKLSRWFIGSETRGRSFRVVNYDMSGDEVISDSGVSVAMQVIQKVYDDTRYLTLGILSFPPMIFSTALKLHTRRYLLYSHTQIKAWQMCIDEA